MSINEKYVKENQKIAIYENLREVIRRLRENRKKVALLYILIFFLFPTIIGYFSIYEHYINSNLENIALIGDFRGTLSWNISSYGLKNNETFAKGQFEGKAVFGEFHGIISGFFFGSLNDTFLGLLNQTSDLTVEEGVLKGFFNGFFEGKATEATPILVLASLGYLVVLEVAFLLLRQKTFKDQVEYLQFLIVCIVAVGLGTDVWLFRITTSSSFPLVETQNFLVYAATPFITIILFLVEKVVALFMFKKISEANKKVDYGFYNSIYVISILFSILMSLYAMSQIIYFSSLIESNPLSVQSFGMIASMILRVCSLNFSIVYGITLLLPFLSCIDVFFFNFLKKDRYFDRIKQFTETVLEPKFDRLFRRFMYICFIPVLLLTIPLILDSLLPSHGVYVHLDFESLLPFLIMASIIFLGTCGVYIYGSFFKVYVQATAEIKDQKNLFRRHIRKRLLFSNLSATLVLLLIGFAVLLTGYLIQFLFSDFTSFTNAAHQLTVIIMPLIFLGVTSIWIFSMVPLYVYSYGWKSIEISAITFFGTFAIKQIIGFITPFVFIGLLASVLGALFSFCLSYIISKHFEKFVKSKLEKKS